MKRMNSEFVRGGVVGCSVGVILATAGVFFTMQRAVRHTVRNSMSGHLDRAWMAGHVQNFNLPVAKECPLCEQASCPECPKAECDLAEQIKQKLSSKPLSAKLLDEEQLALESFNRPATKCVAPANDPAAQSKTLRKLLRVWVDPGPDECPRPFNLDAGLCVRPAFKGTLNGFQYRCLPSALIIGAQKAGTRMLLNYLTVHPRLTAPTAELHFLNRNEPSDKGEFWRAYLDEFPAFTTHDQLAKMLTMEKTPKYMLMPAHQIRRLHELMPSVKLVVSLRDPVDRLYSWFHMKCNPAPKKPKLLRLLLGGPNKGRVVAFETEANVSALKYPHTASICSADAFDALVLSANGTVHSPGDTGIGFALKRGLYAEHLRVWFNIFPKSQFFVLFADSLFKHPVDELRRLETFLRIPHYPYAKVVLLRLLCGYQAGSQKSGLGADTSRNTQRHKSSCRCWHKGGLA